MPYIRLDYVFLRESDSDQIVTVLVMKDRDTKTVFADVVEAKGRGLEGNVENVVRNIARWGLQEHYPLLRPRTSNPRPHHRNCCETRANDPAEFAGGRITGKRTR